MRRGVLIIMVAPSCACGSSTTASTTGGAGGTGAGGQGGQGTSTAGCAQGAECDCTTDADDNELVTIAQP